MTNQQQKHEKQEAADSKKELQLTAAMEELKGDIEKLRNAIAHIASYYDSDLTDEVAKELQLTAAMEESKGDIEELRNAIAHIASYYDAISEDDLTNEVAKEL